MISFVYFCINISKNFMDIFLYKCGFYLQSLFFLSIEKNILSMNFSLEKYKTLVVIAILDKKILSDIIQQTKSTRDFSFLDGKINNKDFSLKDIFQNQLKIKLILLLTKNIFVLFNKIHKRKKNNPQKSAIISR